MVENMKVPNSLAKYLSCSEEELKSMISKFPFFNAPKMALLIKNHDHLDKDFLHHVALTAYDRKVLQSNLSKASFFLT
jgi:hypothetical protein